MASTRGLAAMP